MYARRTLVLLLSLAPLVALGCGSDGDSSDPPVQDLGASDSGAQKPDLGPGPADQGPAGVDQGPAGVDQGPAVVDQGPAAEDLLIVGDCVPQDPDLAPPDLGAPDTGPEPDLGPPPELPLQPTVAPPPDPLAEAAVVSCGVFLEERCAEGRRQRCAVYDVTEGSFPAEVDPLLRRVYLYDRWYDLYGSPDGQTGERVFRQGMPPETLEEVWGAPENFASYAGRGDSAIWTGVALNADAFRYAATGTEADYRRMEERVRTLLTMFDVTGVPGYLARFHFLRMPEGFVQRPEHFYSVAGQENLGRRDMPILDPAAVPDLPAEYLQGVAVEGGEPLHGTPMWHGHPSIDQYTGPMLSFPVVYDLLRDEGLKARLVEHLRCYLNRLQRVELVHLRENEQVLQLVTEFFAGGGSLNLDPDDIDLLDTDRVVAFVHRGINPDNYADFDRTCPAGPAFQPNLVLDARDPDFFTQLVELAFDMLERDGELRPGQIDHLYVPTVRGGDASHMLHLAAMLYRFTGDEQYRRFLWQELVDGMRADRVALTMQALRQPDWCFKYYGDHITFGTHWQLTTLLQDSPLRDTLLRVMHEELWQKALGVHHNAKFDAMYASLGARAALPAHAAALASLQRQLEAFGGGGDVIDSPRRTYTVDPAAVLEGMTEAGIDLRCPSPEERAACALGGQFMGVALEGVDITYECDGRPRECVFDDGRCAEGLAAEGLPPRLRRYADCMWQRSPFHIGEAFGASGTKQSPGRDLAEPFWLGRYYQLLSQGRGQVLAWQDLGDCL